MSKRQTIQEIFEYVFNPTHPLERSDGTIVFGRHDPLVAQRAGDVYKANLTDYMLFTGGIGKDSGYLTDLQMAEAKWQAALANTFHGVPKEKIYVEPNSTNGGENCRNSMDIILEKNLSHETLTLLIHPTTLRRIDAVWKNEAKKKGFEASYQGTGTNYKFDADSPIDQKEAVAELLRLDEWPTKGWCIPQTDLPKNLVEWARENKDRI